MELITRQKNANVAAEAWKRQYFYAGSGWHNPRDRSAESVYNALVALGPEPNPDDVDRIIGNDGWTRTMMRCSECDTYAEPVIQVGQEPDYESSTAWLCRACLVKAVSLSRMETKEDETTFPKCPRCGVEHSDWFDEALRDVDCPNVYDGEIIELRCPACKEHFKVEARVRETYATLPITLTAK